MPISIRTQKQLSGAMLITLLTLVSVGCGPKAMDWQFTGPRVYLIEGTNDDASGGLSQMRNELEQQEVNARVVPYTKWLDIVRDIDSDCDEEVILVGHGHGGFLATQVVRHYAQEHKLKHIDAVFLVDVYNKDWPHSLKQAGICDPHQRPMSTPVGHNALKVRNYLQSCPDCDQWGSNAATTRGSDMQYDHPYYWYDGYWTRDEITGQKWGTAADDDGVYHQTIDNQDVLIQRIVQLCRKAALSPFHYTPPEHYPHEQARRTTQPHRPQTAPGKVW